MFASERVRCRGRCINERNKNALIILGRVRVCARVENSLSGFVQSNSRQLYKMYTQMVMMYSIAII